MDRYCHLVGVALLCAWPAIAAEMPTRKAGLWELKMMFEGGNAPVQSMQQCTDASTDKLMTSSFGARGWEDCSKKDVQVSGNTVTLDSVCKGGGMTVTTHAVVSGDFNSAYTVKVTSQRQGGPPGAAGTGTTNMTIDAKWTGACKPDQKPGDIVMMGQRFNVRDMQSMPGPAGGPPRPGLPPQAK